MLHYSAKGVRDVEPYPLVCVCVCVCVSLGLIFWDPFIRRNKIFSFLAITLVSLENPLAITDQGR